MSVPGGNLARIEGFLARRDAVDGAFRAIVTPTPDLARQAATEADAAAAEGRCLGLLHGMAIAVKDNIDTAGVRTACGSALFAEHVPQADATVVERLKEAGAAIVGKAAMMELAFGVRSLDAVGGQVRNPWNMAHVPGGSSGGSAAAVAAGFCDAALGTDTGGSIRVPASFCGVSGLRPTFGRVPNRGCLPVSESFDTIGPIARHVGDLARILAVIAGPDTADPSSRPMAGDLAWLRPDKDIRGLRIGVLGGFYAHDVDEDVSRALASAQAVLARLGAELVPVILEDAARAQDAATTLIYADACALHAEALDSKRQLISPAVYDRMIRGRALDAPAYAGALRFRERWQRDLRDLFRTVDVVMLPASPGTAPPIEATGGDLHVSTRNATRFTFGGGLAGVPGLALPCGFDRNGLPIGVLFEAAWGNETGLLRLGRAWQAATDWHLRSPPSAAAA
ncbi:MAG: amidase [Acetobacteraceae bacterium]|jgi:aspartyl-tRNA(Asn)/glutamyl-tRNA(Gln) amidotransferase subunit A|nr:amidase [Acetobacteraceae bacterium]